MIIYNADIFVVIVYALVAHGCSRNFVLQYKLCRVLKIKLQIHGMPKSAGEFDELLLHSRYS